MNFNIDEEDYDINFEDLEFFNMKSIWKFIIIVTLIGAAIIGIISTIMFLIYG